MDDIKVLYIYLILRLVFLILQERYNSISCTKTWISWSKSNPLKYFHLFSVNVASLAHLTWYKLFYLNEYCHLKNIKNFGQRSNNFETFDNIDKNETTKPQISKIFVVQQFLQETCFTITVFKSYKRENNGKDGISAWHKKVYGNMSFFIFIWFELFMINKEK